jgi:hypothetical protein
VLGSRMMDAAEKSDE